jgi:hypothetical protein
MMLNRSDRPVSLEAKRLPETTLDLDAVLATRWADPRRSPQRLGFDRARVRRLPPRACRS